MFRISEELHEEEKNDVVPQLTVSEVTNEPERKQEDETTPSNDTGESGLCKLSSKFHEN